MEEIRVFIEDTAGNRFACDIPHNTQLNQIAADFFEDRGWPTTDSAGRGQRAVVELVDPENPDRTKRLRGEQTVEDAGLWNEAVLRIWPESIAGVVDDHKRIQALESDLKDMKELISWNHRIKFEALRETAPTRYTVTFDYPSFQELDRDGHTPLISNEHRVEIILRADYPWNAPRVRWLTPIFHPNISPESGAVCLGVLMDRYLPGLGLARLVTMLSEMVQYRNFDMSNALNQKAAQWTMDPTHWPHIEKIGGSPFQGPVLELLKILEKEEDGGNQRPRIRFKPVTGRGDL